MKRVDTKEVKRRSRELTAYIESYMPHGALQGSEQRVWVTDIAKVWRCSLPVSIPVLKAPGTKRSELRYDELLSSFGFKFQLAPLHQGRHLAGGPHQELRTGASAWGRGAAGPPHGQGLTLAHSRAQLEDLRGTSLTLEINLSTFGPHPRVTLGHMEDIVSLS